MKHVLFTSITAEVKWPRRRYFGRIDEVSVSRKFSFGLTEPAIRLPGVNSVWTSFVLTRKSELRLSPFLFASPLSPSPFLFALAFPASPEIASFVWLLKLAPSRSLDLPYVSSLSHSDDDDKDNYDDDGGEVDYTKRRNR